MKQKSNEQKSENQIMGAGSLNSAGKYSVFPTALIAVFVLIFAVIFFSALFGEGQVKTGSVSPKNVGADAIDIAIATDKAEYEIGESVKLEIKNLGDNAIYLEPCRDIDVFERKENGEWVLKQDEKVVLTYEQTDFEKKSGNTECQISLPESGAGTYRVVVPAFYGCAKPSHYACEGSKVFRSNEFTVAAVEPCCGAVMEPAAGAEAEGAAAVAGSEEESGS